MISKTISYTDYNGNPQTKKFLFNLTKAEIAEMEASEVGGIVNYFQRIVETEDNKQIVAAFKDLILRSYGVKSADGQSFVKNQELRDAFSQTEAYSELFMELAENADVAAAFVAGVIPSMPDKTQPQAFAAVATPN